MELISANKVKAALEKKAKGEYCDAIDNLELGGAIKIHPSVWVRKESIYHYFNVRYKGVSVRSIDGYFYIIKLALVK